MKWERMLLVSFLGNYLINNVAGALASLAPASPGNTSIFTAQYLVFVIAAVIIVALFTWWYLSPAPRMMALKWGAIFGVAGFVVSIATTFVTGVSGVLAQTGSISQVMGVLPNFGPFIWSWTTLVLLGAWIIPAVLIGWFLQMRSKTSAPAHAMPQPMI